MIVNNEHYQSGSSAAICLIDGILECLCRFFARDNSQDVFSARITVTATLYCRLMQSQFKSLKSRKVVSKESSLDGVCRIILG